MADLATEVQTKFCNGCGECKPRTEFYPLTHCGLAVQSRCKVCSRKIHDSWRERNRERCRQYSKAWAEQNADRVLEGKLKRDFGLTLAEYRIMMSTQGGLCLICKKPDASRRLSVDHDHATGRIRGLLCHTGNQGVGYFHDNPAALRRAADYLEARRG